jgi:type I restriction enzyme S subunit
VPCVRWGMNSELFHGWRRLAVGDICRVTSGGTPARARESEFYAGDGHLWVKTKELVDAKITDTEEKITDRALEQSAAKLLPAGTTLVAMYASPTVGRLGYLSREAACNQACAALIPDTAVVDPRFLFFRLMEARTRLQQVAVGSAQQNINASVVRELELTLPLLPEQRRIAGVLGALDDKVEHNRRLTRRLEALIAASTTNLLGEAEVVAPLSSLARFVNGRAFTKDGNGRGRPILRIKELNDGITDATVWSDIGAEDENIARRDDLLFAWSGSLDVYRWDGPEALINQHIFKVIPNHEFPPWLVEHWVSSHLPEFRAIASEKATTMGHIQRRHLDEAMVRVPSLRELDHAHLVLGPSDSFRAALAAESRGLVAVRNALLPKLVSGQVSVSGDYEPGALKSAT